MSKKRLRNSKSIRDQGIVIPLWIAPAQNGRYQLLYGERRLCAALATSLATVPTVIEPKASSWMETLDVQITENLHLVELRSLEIAQTIWCRYRGPNIQVLEQEKAESDEQTAQIVANHLTPAS